MRRLVAGSDHIELPGGDRAAILYEDRSVIALDKPAGWMLAPDYWQRTGRNLHTVLAASIRAGDFWARRRNLKFLRFIHRLDADTTGIVLMARSPGAVRAYSELFAGRQVNKTYWAVVQSQPRDTHWTCREKLAPDPARPARMKVDPRHGKDAETEFRVLKTQGNRTLLEAKPLTGRTHQIRVHLQFSGCPVLGDSLYGSAGRKQTALGLRAVGLQYRDPFTGRVVRIRTQNETFLARFGFDKSDEYLEGEIGNSDS